MLIKKKEQRLNFVIYIRLAEVTEGFATTVFAPDDTPAMQMWSAPNQTTYSQDLPRQVQVVMGIQFKVEKEGSYWFDVSYKGVSLGGAGLPIEYRPVKEEEENSGTDTYV